MTFLAGGLMRAKALPRHSRKPSSTSLGHPWVQIQEYLLGTSGHVPYSTPLPKKRTSLARKHQDQGCQPCYLLSEKQNKTKLVVPCRVKKDFYTAWWSCRYLARNLMLWWFPNFVHRTQLFSHKKWLLLDRFWKPVSGHVLSFQSTNSIRVQ